MYIVNYIVVPISTGAIIVGFGAIVLGSSVIEVNEDMYLGLHE